MPKLWNAALTGFFLYAMFVTCIALTYDGFCYGFTDGKAPCSFLTYVIDNHAWLGFLIPYYFPCLVVVGALIYFTNDAVYGIVTRLASGNRAPERLATRRERRTP